MRVGIFPSNKHEKIGDIHHHRQETPQKESKGDHHYSQTHLKDE
jgi:hypothetical protein